MFGWSAVRQMNGRAAQTRLHQPAFCFAHASSGKRDGTAGGIIIRRPRGRFRCGIRRKRIRSFTRALLNYEFLCCFHSEFWKNSAHEYDFDIPFRKGHIWFRALSEAENILVLRSASNQFTIYKNTFSSKVNYSFIGRI